MTISPPAGPFRDIPAAVRYTASRHNLAVMGGGIDPDDPDTIHIDLISVKDEPATLTLLMPEGWRAADKPLTPLDMQMSIGHFGHTEREQRFLSDLRDRLETVAKSPTASAPMPQ